jgi:intraflagellar transport protein 52
LDADNDDEPELRLVYPFGSSLETGKHTSVILASGQIAYPADRPLICATAYEKGRVVVIGSELIFGEDYLEKEENTLICDGIIRSLLGEGADGMYNFSPEVHMDEYKYIPSVSILSDTVKSCLEDVKEPPKNFKDLFDQKLFKIDNNLVPEAFELYEQLHLKRDTLSIIPPQFETPLPPLQLAVFDPIIKDFPTPKLELFDLDEQFASEDIKLAQLTNKCNDDELEYFVKECGQILGISNKVRNKDDAKAIVYHALKEIVVS